MKIQNYRNSTIFESYEKAVEHIQTVLINDKSIVDGQEIFARYYYNGKVVTIIAAAYVDNNGDVSFSIVNDGMSIISSESEPGAEYRDNYIWLQETDESIQMGENDVAIDIRSMQRAIIELMSIVQRHEYAFQNVMDCGTITNNLREEMMADAVPEAPEGYEDGTQPYLLYVFEEEKSISSITNYYLGTDKSSNVRIDDEGWDEFIPTLSGNTPYLWVYRCIDLFDNTQIKSEPQMVSRFQETRVLENVISYYAAMEDNDAPSKTSGMYSRNLPSLNSVTRYLFNYQECVYVVDDKENKPKYAAATTPNVKHLIIKSANNEQEIKDNILNLLDNELVWCEGNNGLYIRSKGRIVKINGGTISGGITEDENINEIMSGITSSSGCISTIEFITTKGNKYTMKVDDEKGLMVYNSNQDLPCLPPSGEASGEEGGNVKKINKNWEKLYINSLYCGGVTDGNGQDINEHSLNPCSHNFVELSNLTNEDINLNGMSLLYKGGNGIWDEELPLWGTIKSKSTFLIRGAQCSIMDVNSTVIKVNDYDMEWRNKNGDLIRFDNATSKFYLTYKYNDATLYKDQPYIAPNEQQSAVTVSYGYIDLVGFGAVDAYEKKPCTTFNSNYLLRKYYAMDNVTQATKALDKRNNANDWYYVDLTKNDILPNVEIYTPRSSKYNKNVFYDKTQFQEMKPTTLSVSFGIQATDNGEGATRCFSWVSKGVYDEFLWYRLVGETAWRQVESYKGNDNSELIEKNDGSHGYGKKEIGKYYYRLIQEGSNGQVFTSHKVILRKLKAGEYEYFCGKADPKNNNEAILDGCTDIKKFTVRSNEDINENGFSFVHISDQQGFNWDEYQVWKYTSDYIGKYNNEKDENADSIYSGQPINAHFTINTGDITQNGNRLNEWFDYFDGRESLSDLEEMATIGNNDLSPKILYQLADPSQDDASKINPNNIRFFYTFEIDEENPPIFAINDEGEDKTIGYIPSLYSFNYGKTHFLCVNSEIGTQTEQILYGVSKNSSGLIYEQIKKWCETDIKRNSSYNWNIAYCHEMPFTIITDTDINEYYSYFIQGKTSDYNNKERGGSRINVVNKVSNYYWFSEFCQNNNIRLVMGGHKHTQAITFPIKENVINDDNGRRVNSMKPIIQMTTQMLKDNFKSDKLVQINDESVLNGYSYPYSWFKQGVQTTATSQSFKDDIMEKQAHLCTFEIVDKITAPIYSMSQASGYKHTSNNELPGTNIPWLQYYYPNSSGNANDGQKYPFFTIVTINEDYIRLDVRKILNVLAGGKFNVNIQGEALKNNIKSVNTENGIHSESRGTETHIEITK